MTPLDTALANLRQDMNDPRSQSKYYDLFLNTTFYVPTLDGEPPAGEAEALREGEVLPLVIEAEGNDYLMLFDTRERLQAWAGVGARWVEVPGHVLAATTTAPLHWALNAGTDHSKRFLPEEIAWLGDVVERCEARAPQC